MTIEKEQSNKSDLERLTASGILGHYSHFAVTEVFANIKGQPLPINVFTILVAEHRAKDILPTTKTYLTESPIKIKSIKGWKFGVQQYFVSIKETLKEFGQLHNERQWLLSGEPLTIGALHPLPPQLVPPDSSSTIALNQVLKNNFWNGSYVLEWADRKKEALRPFFDNPPCLQDLSAAISRLLPLTLASVSDRLGNIVIQLPIDVCVATFSKLREGGFHLELGWSPQSTPRLLRATVELEYDNVITGYSSSEVTGQSLDIPAPNGQGELRAFLWDDRHKLALAAMGKTGFIDSVAMKMRPVDHEPRIFTVIDSSGESKEVRVTLHQSMASRIGETAADRHGDWVQRRMYTDEAARLAATRRFVQYKPIPGQQDIEHQKALDDIRALLREHGENGAYLWDPFLSGADIVNTLFHCPHFGAELRAMTACEVAPIDAYIAPTFTPAGTLMTYVQTQQAAIATANSNLRGLRLEYRMKTGQAGWHFHDRFLMFPKTDEGALAWSLGTSVNGLGKRHHILQHVSDPQLVVNAFIELWDQLTAPEHLIWKTP